MHRFRLTIALALLAVTLGADNPHVGDFFKRHPLTDTYKKEREAKARYLIMLRSRQRAAYWHQMASYQEPPIWIYPPWGMTHATQFGPFWGVVGPPVWEPPSWHPHER